MQNQNMIAFVCCGLMIFGGMLHGQQTNQAQQNNAGQQNTNPLSPELIPPGRKVITQQQMPTPMAPAWVSTMSKEHHEFIAQVLDYWQKSSQGVKQYVCDFTRYDYDTKFCNYRDPSDNRLAAASIMTGEIRFNAPDNASYETLYVYDFPGPPAEPGQPLKDYVLRKDSNNREKWICDGEAIFEFDYDNEKLYETPIPMKMRGKGLVNSPIPFLFGASREDILNRFWVRTITPKGVQNEYWLEAVPKKIDDARNYKKIELVISRDEFLPIMLHLYSPDYNPKENVFTSRVFEFKNRKVNAAVNRIQNFLGLFVRPSTPMGWDLVKRNALQTADQQLDQARLRQPQTPTNNRQIK